MDDVAHLSQAGQVSYIAVPDVHLTPYNPNMQINLLSFPLNVYARAIESACGEIRTLDYGDFGSVDHDERSILEAQSAFIKLIREALTGDLKGGRILLCGHGLELLVESLVPSFEVINLEQLDDITPQSVYASKPIAELVSGNEGSGKFNCIYLQGSVHYLKQLQILQFIRRLLQPGGTLIWTNEFVIDNTQINLEPVSLHSTFEKLSSRLGFSIDASLNLTNRIIPTIKFVQHAINERGKELENIQGMTGSEIEKAGSAIELLLRAFQNGRQGYFLEKLHLAQTSEFPHSDVIYQDINCFSPVEICKLFESSFGHPFNKALWEWKYTGGNGKSIVARRDSEIIAHYGGAPRKIKFFGASALAIQICDVMVLPEERLYYGNESLFFKVAATFLEREIGNTVEHLLGFGFPNLKAMQMARRLGLYEKTDDFIEVYYPASNTEKTPDAGFGFEQIDFKSDIQKEKIEFLWRIMQADFSNGIVGVRDWAYLNYRYHEHPSNEYNCYLVHAESNNEPAGVLVLKPHEDSYLLMDIVASGENILPLLQSLRLAPASPVSGKAVKCWITRGWSHVLVSHSAIIKELQIEIPCHSWTRGPSVEELYGKWWLTAGDMDFI